MIWFENTWCKIWEIKPADNGKYIDLRITTSEKDKDGNYINSTWWPRCFGKAMESAKAFEVGYRAKIAKGIVSNESKKMEDGSYKSMLRMKIISFDEQNQRKETQGNACDGSAEDMPY